MGWKATRVGCAVALLAGTLGGAPASAEAEPGLFTATEWRQHLTDDLLPFWSDPGAAGTPPGAFPGYLCNDGSVPVNGTGCAGVSPWINTERRTLVAHSRQVFSYAVAFHMTGDTQWLTLAQAGVADQFDTFYDADLNRFGETYLPSNDGPGFLSNPDAQKQAYGLLGPTMVYYLTGDPALYAQIKRVSDGIEQDFRRGDSFTQREWHHGPGERLVDTLDQLNSYQTLLATAAPLADRAALEDRAHRTALDMKARFFDPATGLFKTDATTPDGTLAGQSFGHSIKALWFIDQTAQMVGDIQLAAFASAQAAPLLARAFDPVSGGWHAKTDATGALSDEGVWWDHAELTQYAAALAINRPELRATLTRSQQFWLDNYVDATDGGIWARVSLTDGAPDTEATKHWEWKAGFHSYEHALISYLSAAAMENSAAELYFAREDGSLPDRLAYGFQGDLVLVPGTPALFGSSDGAEAPTVQRVLVSNLDYTDAAALTPVPLPPAALLLLGGVAALGVRGRRPSRGSVR